MKNFKTMTIKELIEELEKAEDKNKEVVVNDIDEDGEYMWESISIKELKETITEFEIII